MSEMMLSIFSGHVSLIIPTANQKLGVCSTSVSKHQFDLLGYFGQSVAKLLPNCKPVNL